MEPAKSELELVAALAPGQIVAILESFKAVLPWIVRWSVGCTQHAGKRNGGHQRRSQSVRNSRLIGRREKAGCRPSCRLLDRYRCSVSIFSGNRRQMDLVAAI